LPLCDDEVVVVDCTDDGCDVVAVTVDDLVVVLEVVESRTWDSDGTTAIICR
jgi:hypothetical protein